MDFLEIRKKAKARAAAAAPPAAPAPAAAPADALPPDRAAAVRAGEALAGAADPAAVAAPRADDGASPARDPRAAAPEREISPDAMSAAEFAARLQSAAADALGGGQFVTWRPGTAARAIAPAPPEERGRAAARRPAPTADPLEEFFYRADEDAPGLDGLGGAAEPGGPAAPVVVLEEYLTFLLGDEEYGVPIGDVREVLKAPAVTEVPRAPAHILGVVTVRGDVVPVFDPRRRLGLPGAPPEHGRLVLVDPGDGPCALLVDAVASVVRLPAGSIEPCPQGIGGQHAECLAGIGREHERLFTVLDVRAVIRARDGRRRAEA